MSSPYKSKGKMKYQYDKELAHAFPSSVTSILDNVLDTKIGHVDVADFLQMIEAPATHEMKRIKRSNIHLVSTFRMATIEPNFVYGCARRFTPKTRNIKDADDKVIISLDPEVIEQIFKVLRKSECADLTKESSLTCWNEQKNNY